MNYVNASWLYAILAAQIASAKVPADVAIPEYTPDEFILQPGGNAPDEIDQT